MTRLSFKDVLSTSYNRYSCLIIIVCQLVAILCAGTIIYILAIVFVPTHHLKFSGFSKNAALCSTVSSEIISECVGQDLPTLSNSINTSYFPSLAWSSCSESCYNANEINDTERSSTTAKDCRQIKVNIRNFGTDISFEGCTDYNIVNCNGINENKNSNTAYQHAHGLIGTGLYRCDISHKTNHKSVHNETETMNNEMDCNEISKYLKCDLSTNEEELIDCSSGLTSCLKPEPGLYQCNSGKCSKVPEPLNCHRICKGIETSGKNVLVHHRDKIHLANCKKARETHSGMELWPKNFKNFVMPSVKPTLLLNCQDIRIRKNFDEFGNHSDSSLIFSDCVNGTVLEKASLPEKTDIQELLTIWSKEMEFDDNLLDPINDKLAPRTSNLSLFWNIHLYFIYDICGNIPSDEDCSLFYIKYGIPAKHHFPQSTFPCFYSNKYRNHNVYAVVEPTRLRTEKEIWKEAVIPTVIAVVSCFIVLVFAVSVTIIVFLHPLINENFSSSATESYDDISHTAGKRPSIIFTKASPVTPTKTAVHNFSLSPGNSYIRRASHPNLNGNATHNSEEGRKRVSWVEPGPVEQRWAY